MDHSFSTTNPEAFDDTEAQSGVEAIHSLEAEGTHEPQHGREGEPASHDEESILRRAAAELAERKAELRALALLASARKDPQASIETIANSLKDPSSTVRAAALRALYERNPNQASAFLTNIIRDSAPDERRKIGTALVESGLITADRMAVEDPQAFYSVLSLLFLLAKTGTVESLLDILKYHPNRALRLALIRTLATSKAPEVRPALEQLLIDPSLERDIRSTIMESVVQLADD